jgi:HJR/Mrr/RecB family endonuclease
VSVSVPGRELELAEYDVRITKRRVEALVNSDIDRPAGGYAHEQDFLASNFPYDCLSAAFAKMALQSILQYDDEFSKRMGMRSVTTRFDLDPRLSTIPPLSDGTESQR